MAGKKGRPGWYSGRYTVLSLETANYRGGWGAGHAKLPAGPLSDSQTVLHPFPGHTFASILDAPDQEKCRIKPSWDASNGKGTCEKLSLAELTATQWELENRDKQREERPVAQGWQPWHCDSEAHCVPWRTSEEINEFFHYRQFLL